MSDHTCSSCGEAQPYEEFWEVSKGKLAVNGKTYGHCRTCTYKRTAILQQKKREWLQAYKVGHGCADCGYDEHPAALDFDHLPGVDKEFDLKDAVSSAGWARLRAEVLKCEVVCANCHRIRTYERHHGAEEDAA